MMAEDSEGMVPEIKFNLTSLHMILVTTHCKSTDSQFEYGNAHPTVGNGPRTRIIGPVSVTVVALKLSHATLCTYSFRSAVRFDSWLERVPERELL